MRSTMWSPNQMGLLRATYNTHTPKWQFSTVREPRELGLSELTLVTLEADVRMGITQDIRLLHDIISQQQKL